MLTCFYWLLIRDYYKLAHLHIPVFFVDQMVIPDCSTTFNFKSEHSSRFMQLLLIRAHLNY